MCSACGWQMGRLVAFMSIVVSTVLVGPSSVSPPVFWCDSVLDKDAGATDLSSKDYCHLGCVLSDSG